MDITIIEACSYIDEYENFFGVYTEENCKLKILEIKKICKPFMSQIKKWTDLRAVRNSYIAHNYRTKNNQMIFNNEIRFNAPRGVYEIELLNYCIQYSHTIIISEFKEQLDQAKKNLNVRFPKCLEFSHEECWKLLNILIEKTNENLKKRNRNYSLKIT